MAEYLCPQYDTIGVQEKRKLVELANSSLLNAFTEDDFYAMLGIFRNVIDRLEKNSVETD